MSRKSQVDCLSRLEQSGPKLAADRSQLLGGQERSELWAFENRAALKQYARRIERDGTAATQLDRFLAENPRLLAQKSGSVAECASVQVPLF
jgi:hypothetical protein